MLLAKEFRVSIGERTPVPPPPPPANHRGPIKVGLGPRSVAGSAGYLILASEEELKACGPAPGDLAVRAFSHESEHDLAVLVSDFLENGSSGAESSWYSSDSDSGFSDIHHLSERILFWKRTVEQYETDLLAEVHSLIVSIKESSLEVVNDAQCNAGCIRQELAKLLRIAGYDAAVCASKWQGDGKFPGGDYEYVDVVTPGLDGVSKRVIIDIDFQSHFEIARAVKPYETVLSSLPVVYVGSLERLDQFLQIMVEATRWSLKQNSMPVPPWRSLPYLQSKWHSPYERLPDPDEQSDHVEHTDFPEHDQCIEFLRDLKSALCSEINAENLKCHASSEQKCDKKWRVKSERKQRPSLLSS